MRRQLTVFIFALFACCISHSQASTASDIEKDKDYLVLPDNPSTIKLQNTDAHKITVIEFFSYGCPACYKLEPHLEKWLRHKPHHVVFERIPVTFQPDWVLYAKAYIALQQLNAHSKINETIFDAIQNQNLKLTDVEVFGDFLQSEHINKTDFINAVHSPSVDVTLSENKKITTDYMVFQVPAIVINGKYKVDPSLSGGDYHRMFETVNALIHQTQHQ